MLVQLKLRLVDQKHVTDRRVRAPVSNTWGDSDVTRSMATIKGKGSPYSITERRVPELIPVLGSQPAGDVSHKPGGRLQLPPQSLSGLLPSLLLGEQRHNGCEQFA